MKRYLLLFSALMCSISIYAQSEDAVLPSEIKQRTVVNELLILKKGYLAAGTSITSTSIDKSFSELGKRENNYDNSTLNGFLNLYFVTFGITDRIQAEVVTRYIRQSFSSSTLFEYSAALLSQRINNTIDNTGLGDTEVIMSFQALSQDVQGSGLVVSAGMGIPTGKKDYTDLVISASEVSYNAPTGQGEFFISPKLRYRKVFFPFSLDLYSEYRIPLGGTKVFFNPTEGSLRTYDFTGIAALSVSAIFNVQLNDWIALKHGVLYQTIQQEEVTGYDFGLETGQLIQYYPYVSFQIRQLRLEQAVAIPLWGKNTAANLSYSLLIKYLF